MAQHNSDSLESFFQKISHKSSTEFMENDWRKMELILEEERKRRRFILWRRWNYIGALVVLILLTGGLYFYIPSNVYNGKEKLNNSFFEKERPKNSTAPAVNNTGYINQVFLAKEDDGILNMVRNDRGAHSGNVGQQIISTPPITAKSKERDKEALFNLPNNKKIIATNLNNADINQFTSRKNEYFFKNQNREHPNIKKAPLIVYDSFSKIYFSGLTNLSSK